MIPIPAPESFHAPDGSRLILRVLEEGDEAALASLLRHADADDVRLRFFVSVRVFDHRFLWPLVHYDHGSGIALAAIQEASGEISGVGRLHCGPDLAEGEFALLVRSDEHRHGLGGHLLLRLIAWARQRGVRRVAGLILRDNAPMLGLCRHVGFTIAADPRDSGVMVAAIDPGAIDAGADRDAQSTTTRVPSLTRP